MSLPRNDTERLDDLRALTALRPLLPDVYLPWTEASLRPAALASVCNDVVVHGRRAVAELGAGVSTVALATLLSRVGGSLVSVEHDAEWLGVVAGLVAGAGVADAVRLRHAPLQDGWYDRGSVRSALAEHPSGPVDLLLVDGPPAWRPGDELARAPAADALAPLLAAGATVVLDDADRPGEQAVLAGWERTHGWRLTPRPDGTAHGLVGLPALAAGARSV